MKSYKQFIIEANKKDLRTGFHGSPNIFKDFNTSEVFLAKNEEEALRYGKNLYNIYFKGKPLFETPTIYVIKKTQIVKTEKVK